MSSAEYAIEVENLQKVYDMGAEKVHALKGVTARFRKGEFWAVMGSSGSGKSTMLQILGCLDRPTSGTYRLDGREVSRLGDDDLSDVRLKYIGFVFQSFNLIPQLTVAENIALPLYYQGVDDRESRRRVEKFAQYVGLANRLSHRPNQLSGGQQQRVAIARALATDPVVILADEPTGNLDTAMSIEIMNLFTELNKQGKTIVMVTHEDDIAAYAGHRLVMRDGLIKEMR
ncbi:MAG: ABC transporter ATP-binding protein [Lentisphaerae bacterium]|jgi:putative ABC transport system ATP-binding protein|nr:ABC transporter ATP-binding protein [Lentisphaerota bacterium]